MECRSMGKVSKYALALICGMQVSALWAADLPLKANTLAPLPQFDPYKIGRAHV